MILGIHWQLDTLITRQILYLTGMQALGKDNYYHQNSTIESKMARLLMKLRDFDHYSQELVFDLEQFD